jgi:hypothetical protein
LNNEFELSPFEHFPLLKKEEQVIILFYMWCLFSDDLDGTSYESYADEAVGAAKFNIQLPKLVFYSVT